MKWRNCIEIGSVILALFCIQASGQEWKPMDGKTPEEVLEDAYEDYSAKRFAEALRKFEWLFLFGHKADPVFDSVRISFVVGGWNDLAEKYPPAKAKLKLLRDARFELVLKSNEKETIVEGFRDVAAIDFATGGQANTARAFTTLHDSSQTNAKLVIGLAKDALFAEGTYSLLNLYIDPYSEIQVAKKQMVEFSQHRDRPESAKQIFQRKFCETALRNIKMMKALGMNSKAIQAARESVETCKDDAFVSDINALMQKI